MGKSKYRRQRKYTIVPEIKQVELDIDPSDLESSISHHTPQQPEFVWPPDETDAVSAARLTALSKKRRARYNKLTKHIAQKYQREYPGFSFWCLYVWTHDFQVYAIFEYGHRFFKAPLTKYRGSCSVRKQLYQDVESSPGL